MYRNLYCWLQWKHHESRNSERTLFSHLKLLARRLYVWSMNSQQITSLTVLYKNLYLFSLLTTFEAPPDTNSSVFVSPKHSWVICKWFTISYVSKYCIQYNNAFVIFCHILYQSIYKVWGSYGFFGGNNLYLQVFQWFTEWKKRACCSSMSTSLFHNVSNRPFVKHF